MQLIGEGRDAPRLAEMLEAMPQLRHLDLYCVEHGENQTILKDPKHMRTLAQATQLQCAPQTEPTYYCSAARHHTCFAGSEIVALGIMRCRAHATARALFTVSV